jgi:hypothetical protein
MATKKITPEMVQAYIDGGNEHGAKCLYCGAGNLIICSPESDGTGSLLYRDVGCRKCEKEWQEQFVLSGITVPMRNGDNEWIPLPPRATP